MRHLSWIQEGVTKALGLEVQNRLLKWQTARGQPPVYPSRHNSRGLRFNRPGEPLPKLLAGLRRDGRAVDVRAVRVSFRPTSPGQPGSTARRVPWATAGCEPCRVAARGLPRSERVTPPGTPAGLSGARVPSRARAG